MNISESLMLGLFLAIICMALIFIKLGIQKIISIIKEKMDEKRYKKRQSEKQAVVVMAEKEPAKKPVPVLPLDATDNGDVLVYSGEVRLETLPQTTFQWRGKYGEDRELVFRKAYCIERTDWDSGINDCVFSVRGRRFADLSFLKGRSISEYPGGYEIREHEDGTRFLFSFEDIPTFDSGDMIWDSIDHIALYCDDEGINMIHCRHGYSIPRIKIYTGLTRSAPGLTEWLKVLGCEDRVGE